MAINDKLTSEVYKNNEIMTTNTKTTNRKKRHDVTADSMKMANLSLRYETTNYTNHSPTKYRVNATKELYIVNVEYV